MENSLDRDFEDFFIKNQELVYKVIKGYIFSDEDAKELTVKAFIIVYKNWQRVAKMQNPRGYLIKVGVNLAKKYRRENGKNISIFSLDENTPANTKSVEDQTFEKDKNQWLSREISKLKDIEKQVIILRDLEGLKFEELSRFLSIPLSTVKSHYRRGKLKIIKSWEVQNGEE